MKLVEAESTGPVEGDAALVTPPRPPHRRVSVSLLFTLTVLIGTVVTIYAAFPARNNVLVTAALAHHREPDHVWDLVGPTLPELKAWLLGVIGKDVPMPGETGAPVPKVLGARRIEILNRTAALVRMQFADDELTYVVQHARGFAPEAIERRDGSFEAIAWRRGTFTIVVVGDAARAATWRAAVRRD